MPYTFDTSALIHLFWPGNYDNEVVFGRLWASFNNIVEDEGIWSVREVYREIERGHGKLVKWAKEHKGIFLAPSEDERRFIRELFENPQYRQLVKIKSIKGGFPDADSFVIAQAKVKEYCVVTQEKWRKDAPRIPNVCESYGIECVDLLGFMNREGWSF